MSDETEKQNVEERAADVGKTEGPLAGERLALARREQQITVLEVAKELHLDEPKVRALEQNKFDVLGAPVFAKGHLRKYATLVGVNIDDVLQDYYRLNRSVGMPPVVGKIRMPARERSPGLWIAMIIVVIIAAAAYWWFVVNVATSAAPNTPDTGFIVPPNDAEYVPGNNGSVVAEAVELPEVGVESEVPAFDAPAVQTTPATVAEQAVADGQVRVTMNFSGDCWTEISDANGQRLFFDLGQDGRSVDVSGQAPLSVLLGNADNVSLRVNGADYVIAPVDRRGQTARLTIRIP